MKDKAFYKKKKASCFFNRPVTIPQCKRDLDKILTSYFKSTNLIDL